MHIHSQARAFRPLPCEEGAVLASGLAPAHLRSRAAGFLGCLAKPVDAQALNTVLNRLHAPAS